MAIKTFATGEVLTASDTNTYLANAGLVYVTSTGAGTAVSTTVVSNAFSSTYDTYRIVISNLTMSSTSTGTAVYLKMHDGTNPANTNYNTGLARIDIAANTIAGVGIALGTNGVLIGRGTGDKFGTSLDVINPNIATHTIFPNLSGVNVSTGYMYQGAGMHQTSTAYTGFQIAVDTGTMTGGLITVYGYRKA